jgi:hypothetical protein
MNRIAGAHTPAARPPHRPAHIIAGVPDVGALAGDAEFAGDLGLGATLGEHHAG